jgi:hypothetical protein
MFLGAISCPEPLSVSLSAAWPPGGEGLCFAMSSCCMMVSFIAGL